MSYLREPVSCLEYTGSSYVNEQITYEPWGCIVTTSWVGGDKNLIAQWLHSNCPGVYSTAGDTAVEIVDDFGYKWAYHFNWREE